MNLAAIQAHLNLARLDGWIVYDFRGSNAIFRQLIPQAKSTTRRCVLIIPARGEPTLLHHAIDQAPLAHVEIAKQLYTGYADFPTTLNSLMSGWRRVAMEYVPMGELPVVSIVDAGTLELVRSLGVEIVSSADLVSLAVAAFEGDVLQQHIQANAVVGQIRDAAFALMSKSLRSKTSLSEHDVQQFILKRFVAEGIEADHGPIVAFNGHAGDPHFEPASEGSSILKPGDWVLLDMWARFPGEANVFADITWCASVGRPTDEMQRAFDITLAARDASLALAQSRWTSKTPVAGHELDVAARDVLIAAGYESALRHRTGHSLSPGASTHGLGMNLDSIETRDTRAMLPRTGFTIEPGVYFSHFGVRSEIDVYVDPAKGPILASDIQRELVRLD